MRKEFLPHEKPTEAARRESIRILAGDHRISNDTWKTHLNNNDLVIGISGGIEGKVPS